MTSKETPNAPGTQNNSIWNQTGWPRSCQGTAGIAGLLDAHPKSRTSCSKTWHLWECSATLERRPFREQILRALIIKQLNGFSYRELAFHLTDSSSYRKFTQLGWTNRSPNRGGLLHQGDPARDARAINRLLLGIAQKKRIEDGKTSAWIPRWWKRTFIRRSIRIFCGTVCAW